MNMHQHNIFCVTGATSAEGMRRDWLGLEHPIDAPIATPAGYCRQYQPAHGAPWVMPCGAIIYERAFK